MKVLVLGRGLPGEGQPLLGIFEFQQAKALAQSGHDVVYGALDVRFIHHLRPFGVRRVTVDGVHVVELSLPLGRLQYRGGYRLIAGLWKLLYRACVHFHGRPDVVHSHFVGWSAAAAKGKRRHGYPLVVTEHTSRLMAADPPASMLRGIQIAYDHADVLIAVSPGLRDRIKQLTGHDAVYVPNLVDAEAFAAVEPTPHSPRQIVTVGNLIPRKQVDLLIKAFTHLDGPLADTRLLIIGQGPQLQSLRALADHLRVGERVSFAGGLSHAEIAERFSTGDVFALASAQETFGVVLIEAMAAGLPVVSTRSGGPEGFVTPQTGILVDGDVADLAAGLRDALTRDWDRDAIRDYAVAHHSPAVVAARLTALYGEAVALSTSHRRGTSHS